MVHLSWAPSPDVHNSPVTHYIIEMRVGENGRWDIHNGITTPNSDSNYQIRGLQPYTVYSFRVSAVNSMGRGLPSKESFYTVTLREVPDGKPLITTAHNTSSTSLLISWKAPPKETIHGEFLGYRISYRPRDKGEKDAKETYIRDPKVESHTLTGLDTYTQYLVSLQVFNPEGPGPITTVLVMTDEGVPSKPMNVTVLKVTATLIDLGWHEPVQPNGDILGYRIYYMQFNETYYRSVGVAEPYVEYNLTSLRPFTDYKIWVIAFTKAHDGVSSDPINQKTDISGPSSPNILNLTCQAEDALFLQWQRPQEFNNSIDYYYVGYRDEQAFMYEEIVINVTPERVEESIIIPNLTMDTTYEIKVRGATVSIFDPVKIVLGKESEAKRVYVTKDCDKIQYFPVKKTNELSAGMIAGVVCAAFAVVLAVIAYILWRKCFHAAYYYLDDPPRLPLPPLVEWESKPDNCKPGISVLIFPKCVAELHADGDIGFSKEYDSIQASSTQDVYTCEHSQHPDNKQKNRYLNILAYDHSRVQLLPVPGQKKSLDYVNANYIDGYMRSRAYIGTQGPLPVTFNCFWRMVWEQRVAIIVMITNLVERGRRKCDMYWPKEGAETYGVIEVTLVKEDVLATYTVRTLQIRHLRIKKKKHACNDRFVHQYHYTNWPDHGTPDHPLPVLSFVKKSSAANPTDAGPIIVHCSAGVGRTGTYIVLDAMLKQIRAKGEVNIYGFLRHIRTQRNYLVQTEEQYIFIHDALLEAIESGETNVNQAYLSRYIHSLMTSVYEDDKGEVMKLLDRQYMQVTMFEPKDFQIMSARKPCNIIKNRNTDIVPVEAARVHLTPKPGVDGSDYINATWLQGFNKLKEFIISQHPLDITVYDFWQMVWDQNAQTIVMLSSLDDEENDCYWPTEEGDLESDNFKVKFIEKHDHIGYQTRDFTVHSLQDDYELPVRLIQCTNWLDNCSSVVSIFDTINMVQEWHAGFQNGPMIVIDSYGGTEAATFCCLTTLMKQLEFEKHVDVYMYAKLYHNRRPGIWRSLDDYLYLYRAMEALIGTMGNQVAAPTLAPDIYLTINGNVNGYVNNGNGHVNSGNGITRLSPEGMEPAQKIKDSMA
ncbi:putative receptor-type tyrosine-protein phosphatase mosPTP-1 isoform X2 [Hetaerina americana]|uniref:putative receptor-type tyrosine-protein phosphatase mosPTP-1 isoform X2 n=1 Tax=Hetaerina americana TaxID=62018 RepID=UPI003A7F5059